MLHVGSMFNIEHSYYCIGIRDNDGGFIDSSIILTNHTEDRVTIGFYTYKGYMELRHINYIGLDGVDE